MKTQLNQGAGTSSEPGSGSNVFGVISSALDKASRRLGCWDTTRLTDGGAHRRDVTPDPTITPEALVYACATA